MVRLRVHDVRLSTPRLVLRPMAEADWPTLLKWNQDPRVLATWDSDNVEPWSLEKLQDVYREISQHALMFIIEYGNRAIGEAWVQEMNLPEILEQLPGQSLRRIDLSIGEPELWGQGFGTEAARALVHHGFTQMNTDALFACHVRDSNPASRRVFEKNGFVVLTQVRTGGVDKEGTSTNHLILTRNRWQDVTRVSDAAVAVIDTE